MTFAHYSLSQTCSVFRRWTIDDRRFDIVHRLSPIVGQTSTTTRFGLPQRTHRAKRSAISASILCDLCALCGSTLVVILAATARAVVHARRGLDQLDG